MEPFCFPDVIIGPDILALMWNPYYTDYRLMLIKSTFKIAVAEESALATLVPEWLYMSKRNTSAATPAFTTTESVQSWEAAKKLLVPDDKECVRVLIKYPKSVDEVSQAGWCSKGSFALYNPSNLTEILDYLYIIDGLDSASFFDTRTLTVTAFKEGSLKKKRKAEANN